MGIVPEFISKFFKGNKTEAPTPRTVEDRLADINAIRNRQTESASVPTMPGAKEPLQPTPSPTSGEKPA